MKKHQVIFVGMGLATLSAAARLYELGITDIGIYTKGYGGTPYIAAINFVLPNNPYNDTIEQYAQDMIEAGYRINNNDLVHDMTSNTLNGYNLLKRWGIEFSKNSDESVKLRHLSGHKYPRSLCSTKDLIGVEFVKILEKRLIETGIEVYTNYECVKLLAQDNKIHGITVKNPQGKLENIYSNVVVAAWGGIGNLFGTSTYPQDIKGNTLAIAKEVGAKLVDLEFIEYEPMVIISPSGVKGEPCPTAMLGEGAYLLNNKKERFILKNRNQGEAGAPKTFLNKEIWKEIKNGNGTEKGAVWADLRHIDREILKSYPWLFERLMNNGIDPNRDLLEVAPMSHSFSGGIVVDRNYHSNIEGLFAIGEACGGTHGACRCAGNAASQGCLSGMLCGEAIKKLGLAINYNGKEIHVEYSTNKEIYDKYIPKAKKIAMETIGIYRNGDQLKKTKITIEEFLSEKEVTQDTETEQILKSILLIVNAALIREESRGTHMRVDFPEESIMFEKELIQ